MIFLVYSQFHCAIFVLRNMKLIISIFAFSGGSADGPFLRKKQLSYSAVVLILVGMSYFYLETRVMIKI